MKIYLQGHQNKYELMLMAHLFFPKEKIEFVDKEPEQYGNHLIILSKLESDDDNIYVKTYIYDGQKTVEGFEMSPLDALQLNDEYQFKKKCREAVKVSFYRAAKQISKEKTPWGILTGIRPGKIVRTFKEEGKNEENIEKILTEQYAISSEKIGLIFEVVQNEQKVLDKLKPTDIGVYVGIPFCPTRCIYCSFISNSVQRAKRFIEPFMDSLIKEIQHTTQIIEDMNWQAACIYIGGGTPTTLTPEQLERLLYELCSRLDMHYIKEFTVEAGRPDTIDEEKLKVLKKYGVSRISINPQTMNESTLQAIGRCHTVEDIIKAFALARELGYDNINMDVIAGLPGETFDMYKHTVTEVQKLDPENITVHTMSIKKASTLSQQKDNLVMTRAGIVEDMLSYTQQCMFKENFHPYYLYRQKNMLANLENIGYCKTGYECIYNILMMAEKHSVMAMGSDAATKMVDQQSNRIDRIFNVKEVEEYINRIDEMIERKQAVYTYFGGKD